MSDKIFGPGTDCYNKIIYCIKILFLMIFKEAYTGASNDLQRATDLVAKVQEIAEREAPGSTVKALISGEAFLTPPGLLYDLVVSSIREEIGIEPALSTGGGTSDGRFLIKLCPVVDFGLPNATMHKLDECAAVEDIHALSRIYGRVIAKAFS